MLSDAARQVLECAKETPWTLMGGDPDEEAIVHAVNHHARDRELLAVARDALKKAKVRLGICSDRMVACGPEMHEVSRIELPAWIEEMDRVLAELGTEAP